MTKRAAAALTDLEKLLAETKKRKERIKAAEDALAEKPADTAPAEEPAPTITAPVAASSSAPDTALAEPTDILPIFSRAASPIAITPVAADDADNNDPLISMLAGQQAEAPAVAELLHGGWMRAHYQRNACPPSVARWLFAVACYHKRAETSSAAARTLSALLQEKSAGWVAGPTDFLEALRRYGADLSELGPGAEAAVTAKEDDSGSGVPATAIDDRRQNLLATLELLPQCVRWSATRAPTSCAGSFA